MNEITNPTPVPKKEIPLSELTAEILEIPREEISSKPSIRMPIAELATLGAGVSVLLPGLRTVTETTTFNMQGLYQLANQSIGDTLKLCKKNGNFYGAFHTADGGSKFAQLKNASPISVTSTTTIPIDPATMMMAVALYSIKRQLGEISDTVKNILSFLEAEKESEIEGDLKTLSSLMEKYKHNWENEHFIASNHKMALDIQRTARKHIISYLKAVDGILASRQKQTAVSKKLEKDFRYYRISLYTFSMASLMEILLSGNFSEENISVIKSEVERLSLDYRERYSQCSLYLEKTGLTSVKANLLKGTGMASGTVGKVIGAIPLVKKGPVDEFLQDKGDLLKESASRVGKNAVESFASISNPGTGVFVEKMEKMIQIYNHTSKICFDRENIYLVSQ